MKDFLLLAPQTRGLHASTGVLGPPAPRGTRQSRPRGCFTHSGAVSLLRDTDFRISPVLQRAVGKLTQPVSPWSKDTSVLRPPSSRDAVLILPGYLLYKHP